MKKCSKKMYNILILRLPFGYDKKIKIILKFLQKGFNSLYKFQGVSVGEFTVIHAYWHYAIPF